MVQALVLVVLACSSIRNFMAWAAQADSWVWSRASCNPNPVRALHSNHSHNPFGPAQPVKTLLQPTSREKRCFSALHSQKRSHSFSTFGIHDPVLSDSSNRTSDPRLVVVLARLLRTLLGRDQRFLAACSCYYHPLACYFGFFVCDGQSLVF